MEKKCNLYPVPQHKTTKAVFRYPEKENPLGKPRAGGDEERQLRAQGSSRSLENMVQGSAATDIIYTQTCFSN